MIISVEEQVELMDRKAEDFYQELIKLMDETRRADTQEVDYIIKLVRASPRDRELLNFISFLNVFNLSNLIFSD